MTVTGPFMLLSITVTTDGRAAAAAAGAAARRQVVMNASTPPLAESEDHDDANTRQARAGTEVKMTYNHSSDPCNAQVQTDMSQSSDLLLPLSFLCAYFCLL